MKPLLLAAAAWLIAAAAPARAEEPPVQAVRLAPGERLVLDGTLAHPAWRRAPAHEAFVEKFPETGGPPPQVTRVQVLYDERALWVGVTALETEPERIRDVPVRADGVNRTQDFVVVYVDAIGHQRAAQFFRVNAAGSTADGIQTASDDSEDFAPDFDWDAAVSRQEQGWTAVLRLPFASLRFAEGPQQWRIMVARRLPREQFHLSTSVLIPRDAPSFIARMQPLQGVELPADHAFLTVRPSVTVRRESGDGAARTKTEASLDLKWRPRAELLLDGTLNPDFSQIEVDVPQLAGNTRFALSFPEKRPFFFESADLLRSPTEAFYTRSFTAPRGGLRGTWRGTRFSGSAFAIDDRGGGFVLLPGPYGTGVVEQPRSRTLAARGLFDEGALQAGALAVARRYEGGGENLVAGPDLSWQLDGAWRVRTQWLHSHSSAFVPEGAAADGDRWYAKLWRLAEDNQLVFAVDDIGSGFRHDSGFVNQAGVRQLTAFGNRSWFNVGPFNQFDVDLQVDQGRDRDRGLLVSQDLRPGLHFFGASNLEGWVQWHPQSLLRPDPQAALLRQHFVSAGMVVTPAAWFPLLDTELSVGRLADTLAEQVRPGLRWTTGTKLRPLRALEFEPSLSLAWLRRDGTQTYRESAARMLAVWHFDARNTLRLIWQRGVLDRRAEPGVEAERTTDRVASLTYAWRRSSGTVFYLGATRSRSATPAGGARANEVFAKLQVDFDEARAALPGS